MVKVSGIYKIVHVATGRCYVGQAQDVHKRIQDHFVMLDKKSHHSHHLQHAWDFYGSGEFRSEVIEYCDLDDLNTREQFWIDSLPSKFNHCRVAGSTRGKPCSESSKAKQRAAITGRKYSEEHRRKISIALKGKRNSLGHRHSEETKAKIRASQIGNKHGLGNKLSAEHRAKLIAANKRRKGTRKVAK